MSLPTTQPNEKSNTDSGSGLLGGAFNAITGGAMGHVMGLLFGGAEDNRQYNQQKRLQGLQIEGGKEMADYMQDKQIETWLETNYPAQVEEMKLAGLSPGLMYKQGGDGGTLGAGAAPMPTGGQSADSAARTSAEASQMGMGLQMAQMGLIKAQTENVQADTAVKKEQAPNVKADTAVKTQSLENLIADVDNTKAKTVLTDVQTRLAGLEEKFQGETLDWREASAALLPEYNRAMTHIAEISENIQDATKMTAIDTIRQSYTNLTIQAAAMEQGIKLDQAKIQEIGNSINQKWKQIDISQQDVNAKNRAITEYTKTMLIAAGINAAGNIINNVVDIATRRPPQQGHETRPIQGERDETGNYIPGGTTTKYQW